MALNGKKPVVRVRDWCAARICVLCGYAPHLTYTTVITEISASVHGWKRRMCSVLNSVLFAYLTFKKKTYRP